MVNEWPPPPPPGADEPPRADAPQPDRPPDSGPLRGVDVFRSIYAGVCPEPPPTPMPHHIDAVKIQIDADGIFWFGFLIPPNELESIVAYVSGALVECKLRGPKKITVQFRPEDPKVGHHHDADLIVFLQALEHRYLAPLRHRIVEWVAQGNPYTLADVELTPQGYRDAGGPPIPYRQFDTLEPVKPKRRLAVPYDTATYRSIPVKERAPNALLLAPTLKALAHRIGT